MSLYMNPFTLNRNFEQCDEQEATWKISHVDNTPSGRIFTVHAKSATGVWQPFPIRTFTSYRATADRAGIANDFLGSFKMHELDLVKAGIPLDQVSHSRNRVSAKQVRELAHDLKLCLFKTSRGWGLAEPQQCTRHSSLAETHDRLLQLQARKAALPPPVQWFEHRDGTYKGRRARAQVDETREVIRVQVYYGNEDGWHTVWMQPRADFARNNPTSEFRKTEEDA